ncbi:MAG: putative metal-binding motif-containing protein [Myxococcota bacterium]|nr:putative metal-binding motif-containing protein [Myxococcota bacterium]
MGQIGCILVLIFVSAALGCTSANPDFTGASPTDQLEIAGQNANSTQGVERGNGPTDPTPTTSEPVNRSAPMGPSGGTMVTPMQPSSGGRSLPTDNVLRGGTDDTMMGAMQPIAGGSISEVSPSGGVAGPMGANDQDTIGGATPASDRDDDGFNDAEDCQPDDPDSFPGASERCDFIDNDCDESIDENVPDCCAAGETKPCGSDVGLCVPGLQVCMAGGAFGPCTGQVSPSPDVCNAVDDDCDGQLDEGLTRECVSDCGQGREICQTGRWGQCAPLNPPSEACNGIDDDCDNQVDEDVTLMACASVCGPGIERCTDGEVICDAPQPENERCDGRDNDCDGQIDEDLVDLCVHLLGQVDGPPGAIEFGTDIQSIGDLTGDGVSDVVANSGGNGARFIAVVDGQNASVSCAKNGGNGGFANAFAIGDLVPGGSREIVVSVRDRSNPTVRVFDSACQEQNNLNISGTPALRARGDIAMLEGYAGFAVSDPQWNVATGRVLIYAYENGALNQVWNFTGDVGRRSVGERIYLVDSFDQDEEPDVLATVRQGNSIRATSLYYSDPRVDPSPTFRATVTTQNSHGESIISGDLLNIDQQIFAFGAPAIPYEGGQSGGVYFATAQPVLIQDGSPLRPVGNGINVGRRLGQYRSIERAQTYVIPAGEYGRLEIWSLRLRNNGTIQRNVAAQLQPPEANTRFGWSVATGGAGEDGTGRLFVSAPDAGDGGRVYVYSIR